jgi:H+/Cl- antiporter ClcA
MRQQAQSISVRKILNERKNFLLIFIIFFSAIVVGFVAVLYNYGFLIGILLARKRFNETPELIFFITPLFFLASSFLCRKLAPHAAGGGTEQVMAALRKLSDPSVRSEGVGEYLGFKVLIIKIVSSIVCISGGGALGREGPVVQISASIFTLIGERIRKIIPSFDLRTWIVAGSAAGMAAAFNTPLAGIVFAIEELSQFHFEQKFSGFKEKTFFAVIVAGVTAQLITGSYTLFGFPIMHVDWSVSIAIAFVLISVVCGFCAVLLKILSSKATKLRNSIKGAAWYFIPVLCGLIVATVSYIWGVNTFGAGLFTIEASIKSSNAVITYQESIGRFVNVIATMAAGCAGGMLLPSLAIGAGIGSLGSDFLPLVDARIFMTAGMAAFLGAILNAPLTAAVLVMEITNQRELIFPLFLSTLVASWIFQKCFVEQEEIAKTGIVIPG